MDVVSLGPGGVPIEGAGDVSSLPGLPPPALTGTDGVVFRRQAENPREEGYGLYLSEEIVAIADLRASKAYGRTVLESDACTRCDAAAAGVGADAREILSGDVIAVRFSASARTALELIYGSAALDAAEITIPSVRWEASPSVRQEPTLQPSLGFGQVAPGTLLASGEMTLSATDLVVQGRRLAFVFSRTHRSQTTGAGPLGPGWDFGYRQRLRPLPNGDVELYDGTGRRELFRLQSEGTYQAPAGRFESLSTSAAGYVLLDPETNQRRFDPHGRLVALADFVKDSADTGNEMTFHYDAASRLVRVMDDLGRAYHLSYDVAGRLTELVDFDGRTVTYGYDGAGRLESVILPAVTVGESTFPQGRTTTYSYEVAGTGSLAQRLGRRDDLLSVTDARDETVLELTYTDADDDGRAQEVTGQTWGEDDLSITYDFGSRTATVTDRRGHSSTVTHNATGQAVSHLDASGETWSWTHDEEGLVTSSTTPLGRVTEWVYDAPCDGNPSNYQSRRSRGNVSRVTQRPEPGNALDTNGSSAELVTCIDYDRRTNQPTRMVDPRGTVTEITRERGLPKEIKEGVGSPEEPSTRIAYNPHGQPVRITNANGHVTELRYHESGPGRGYLAQEIVDPGALALTTRYETDARGNVTAVVDPRGARHEQRWNEADWLVSRKLAAGGTQEGNDSQPALNLESRWTYDALGQILATAVPYGLDGSDRTEETRTYGLLGELLTLSREIEPGGAAVGQTFAYDANRNLVSHTREAGQVTTTVYDERDLAVEITTASGTAEGVTEAVGYDADGRQVSWTDGRSQTWTTEYDGYGRTARLTDPLGHTSWTEYDDGGLPLRARRLPSISATEPLAETLYFHDALGRRTEERRKLWGPGASPAAAQDVVTTLTYDALDQVVTVTDPLGRVTSRTYDAAERLVETLDPAGNRTVLGLDRAGNVRQVTTHEVGEGGDLAAVVNEAAIHDALGRVVSVADGLGNTTSLTLDARGQVRIARDPEGFVTRSTYDGLGRLTETEQPEGIRVTYEYDVASRLVRYEDAQGHATLYAYDAHDRITSTTYPDSTVHTRTYDGSHHLATWTDANGTTVTQTHDAAGRLTTRAVVLGPGVIGPTAETYAYDALDRLTQAVSGSGLEAVETTLVYDSLSRLAEETTLGHVVGYWRDAAGNTTALGYPSGLVLGREVDALDRPRRIGPLTGSPSSPTLTPDVTYGYRGRTLLSSKTLGNGLAGSWSYDGARRPLSTAFSNNGGDVIFRERRSWSPRSLKTAVTRDDLGSDGRVLRYDRAGRLGQALETPAAVDSLANNAPPPLPGTPGQPDSFDYAYDAAQNLVHRRGKGLGEADVALPPDASGRNRPASAGETPLAWDTNGNLSQKGDLHLAYDFRNRLTRIEDAGGAEIASYAYDVFNRRVNKAVAGQAAVDYVWSGLRSVEERVAGTTRHRRTYGAGLDEIVHAELDLDGDGTFETEFTPLYDGSGNLVMLTGTAGQKVGEFVLSPYGAQWALKVDVTPAAVESVLADEVEITLEISEEVNAQRLEEGLLGSGVVVEGTGSGGGTLRAGGANPSLQNVHGASTISVTAERPVQQGRQARRRIVLTPETPPAEGTQVTLTIAPETLADLFLNEPAAPFSVTFTWPAAGSGPVVVHDSAAPRIDQVVLESGLLEIQLSEPIDLATTDAIEVDGQTDTWTQLEDGYTLRSTTPLSTGPHTLTVSTALQDLAGTGLAESFEQNFTQEADPAAAQSQAGLLEAIAAPDTTGTIRVYGRPPADQVDLDTLSFLYGFHGRPRDLETGFVYFRNRYYDPDLGRFITADPLGYVDGPSQYLFAGYDPVNMGDPLGLCMGLAKYPGPCSFYADAVQEKVAGGVKAFVKIFGEVPEEEDHPLHPLKLTPELVGGVFGGVLRLGSGLGRHVAAWQDLFFRSGRMTEAELAELELEMEFSQNEAIFEVLTIAGLTRGGVASGRAVWGRLTRAEAELLETQAWSRLSSGFGAGEGQRSVTLDPTAIRFSQSNVRSTLPELTQNMKAGGWRGAPIDVVRMSDGTLVAVDNTRLAAASLTQTPVQAVIRGFDEVFPATRAGGNLQGATWGEAVLNRIAGQKPAWQRLYPQGAPFTGVHPSTSGFAP